jgi:two-component system sensor histidine kinase KdpD
MPLPAAKRGRLKIFLGYASGVGKTFRMLDEARRRKERGEDVIVVAYQPGAQAEVRTLLDQLETIPTLRTSLGEGLHMDAILRRKPQVCVIDPLAHNNPRGFQNAKRWQDIEQLLQSGISVLTAVNLLHIEEIRERVESITGKHTRESVPREFLARADEIVVVDAPTRVAMEHRDAVAAESASTPERRLAELREMALVLAAEVVDRQLERYLETHGIAQTWAAQERILVCITPRSNGEAMIASGKRNQERFHGEFHVLYVRQSHVSTAERNRINRFLDLAKEAGAQVRVLEADDSVAAILEYARRKRITQIFVGHSRRGDWLSRLWRNPLDRLLRDAETMDLRIFPQ